MNEQSIDDLFTQYRERFGAYLQLPPLEYGQHNISLEDLCGYAQRALNAGKPIDWAEHLAPLPPGALS